MNLDEHPSENVTSTSFCPIETSSHEHVYVINTPPLLINQQEPSIQVKDDFYNVERPSVLVPNVRDKNGNVIKPHQYKNHLEKDGPVMVNVFPMM